jgi:SAM-dependent methyltransferase
LISESQPSAPEFYCSPKVVADYEDGRTSRIFVKDFPTTIRMARQSGRLGKIPFYTVFDWLYNNRLQDLCGDALEGSVLDLACGTSYVYRNILADGWRGHVSGVDVSCAMLNEGTKQLRRMLDYSPTRTRVVDGLFHYRDALGRSTIDVAPPRHLIDKESIRFLLAHREKQDVTRLPKSSYTTLTAFSGPFCYYNVDRQKKMVEDACDRAEKTVVLQFKNSGFATLTLSAELTQNVAAVISHILTERIVDSYSFLESIDFDLDFDHSVHRENLLHEVGHFRYYFVSPNIISKWLADAGFRIVRMGTMGFMSQTFYDLAYAHYVKNRDNPTSLDIFFRALIGIDEFFCARRLLGDNLHVTAVRRASLNAQFLEYEPANTFRIGYRARDAADDLF